MVSSSALGSSGTSHHKLSHQASPHIWGTRMTGQRSDSMMRTQATQIEIGGILVALRSNPHSEVSIPKLGSSCTW